MQCRTAKKDPFLPHSPALGWPALVIVFLLTFAVAHPLDAGTGEESVQAALGLEIASQGQSSAAKSKDHIKAGDILRLFVVPKTTGFVYIISSDRDQAAWLNSGAESRPLKSDEILMFPAGSEAIRLDGANPVEWLTVVYSPAPLAEIPALFSKGAVEKPRWSALEKKYQEASRISLGERFEPPLQMGGNVRALPDPFLKNLKTYSGKSLLIKTYELHVEK